MHKMNPTNRFILHHFSLPLIVLLFFNLRYSQWAQSVGGSDHDDASSIAVDASGNIYVTGSFSGTADFDPGLGTAYLNAGGDSDPFFA